MSALFVFESNVDDIFQFILSYLECYLKVEWYALGK